MIIIGACVVVKDRTLKVGGTLSWTQPERCYRRPNSVWTHLPRAALGPRLAAKVVCQARYVAFYCAVFCCRIQTVE